MSLTYGASTWKRQGDWSSETAFPGCHIPNAYKGSLDVTEQSIIDRVKEALSPARFMHTQGVVDTAANLAGRYGADVRWTRLGAWVHDIAREWPYQQLEQYAEQIEIPSGFALIPNLLHGPIAASIFRDWFGPDHADVENAIRYHTTGRPGMSKMEMILCLADAIEPSRKYPGVERIRELAERDLGEALAESLDSTIRYLLDRHEPIFPLTVMARNELWERYKTSAEKTG
ncbi:bis(5'-nucleosyl)-tetraphosphatase (symmetrical) YqeK [Alicyclobacillus mengziensis]|uniref:bis(5'-nucleosyl)-tetraphosphatase (symmetrical) n=1 Tax=Alicyclobacillus mengziensis TaxID=2931921 RepID=A0A9X7Z886_9BACL|nr:bis(5'-nucleosyl)-tetraphosphatase (symmetrical) YqeK [Alicyclobacillus mengziensis]